MNQKTNLRTVGFLVTGVVTGFAGLSLLASLSWSQTAPRCVTYSESGPLDPTPGERRQICEHPDHAVLISSIDPSGTDVVGGVLLLLQAKFRSYTLDGQMAHVVAKRDVEWLASELTRLKLNVKAAPVWGAKDLVALDLGSIICSFAAGTTDARFAEMAETHGVTLKRINRWGDDFNMVKWQAEDTFSILKTLASEPEFKYCEANFTYVSGIGPSPQE